jgi:hemerythrin-like domain-containing protein
LEAAIEEYEKNPITDHKLDIISNAVGYGALLQRHIEKEDQAAYAFAARALPADKMNDVDAETESFEVKAREDGIQEHYESWLRSKLG